MLAPAKVYKKAYTNAYGMFQFSFLLAPVVAPKGKYVFVLNEIEKGWHQKSGQLAFRLVIEQQA